MDEQPEVTQTDLFIHDLAQRQNPGNIRGILVPPQSNYARDEEWQWEERSEHPNGDITVRKYHLVLSVEVELWRHDGDGDDAPG